MKVFLIDDDEVSRFLFQGTLDRTDFDIEFHSFASGEEVLEALNSMTDYPDIIFLDLTMPMMDGWEVLDQIVEQVPQLIGLSKIYILTSSVRMADEDKSKQYPLVTGYLQKPINYEVLQEILEDKA